MTCIVDATSDIVFVCWLKRQSSFVVPIEHFTLFSFLQKLIFFFERTALDECVSIDIVENYKTMAQKLIFASYLLKHIVYEALLQCKTYCGQQTLTL